MTWITPRIWRSPESRFNDDEPLHSADVYTEDALRDIRSQGFDAIWMRGRLRELMHSAIFPELNNAQASQRIEHLQEVIRRCQNLGMKLFLFFNEPLSLPSGHPFWRDHPDVQGQPHCDYDAADGEGRNVEVTSLCTSTPQVQAFMNESVTNLYTDLPGLGGVILITASEYHTHCFSHYAIRRTGDAFIHRCIGPMTCPRCAQRRPADVVAELISVWQGAAKDHSPSPDVWVWNWSWSMWYEEPEREILQALPEGVKLLLDFERGGIRKQQNGDVSIDEYALGYVGPSQRFLDSANVARKKHIPVCGKLQIGTTHELATVPNLPLIPNLFDKLRKADELCLNGLMFSWNFGNTPSLNTAAVRLFVERKGLRNDKERFLDTLAREYFGNIDVEKTVNAWERFCESFAQFPFSTDMLYLGPMNYSVAYPLQYQYEDRPMGASWIWHEPFGDRLEDCIEPFSLDEVCACFTTMEQFWTDGLRLYQEAFVGEENTHQKNERLCAEMIGCHISAARMIFEFHQWRRESMKAKGLEGPCKLQAGPKATDVIHRHIQTCNKALLLAQENSHFGEHQEPHTHFYDANSIEKCIAEMKAVLL